MQELQTTQKSVSVELGEKQSLCQQLRSTVDTLAAELAQAEETKKQVTCFVHCSGFTVNLIQPCIDIPNISGNV